MLEKKYQDQLKAIVRQHLPADQYKVFIFGSSTRKERFGDVDIAVQGKADWRETMNLRESLEESTFPYFVDVVDFDAADESFRNYVLDNEPKIWI